jgi:Ca-activated chloride channel family protein
LVSILGLFSDCGNHGRYAERHKTMRNSSVNNCRSSRFWAAVAVSGLVIASCGSDDDASSDVTGGEDAPSATEARSDAGVRDEDAEAELSVETKSETVSTDAPAETEAPAEAAADEGDTAYDAPAASGERAADAEDSIAVGAPGEDAEGGLFESAPVDADEPSEPSFEESRFEDYGYRQFIPTARDALSTFALDVDTGSFTIGRRSLENGALPPIESVRPEEYINAFDYDYNAPRDGLDIIVDGGPSPFDSDNHLVRIGVQAEIVEDEDRGPASLTFVIDRSGSMDRPDRLGLVKTSLINLVDNLNNDDTVAIVTYSDSSGVVLNPTPVSNKFEIIQAIGLLGPGGSTNLEAGLREGYALARESFQRDGINRVILASDGVANSGQTDPDALAALIRDDADRGINLVTVGYGMGDFNDVTMEQLADRGDGFYAYVDTEDEAERLFDDELTSTLLTVAKDAKIQVEFDDNVVKAYRLIGFENRGVRDSDFRNDDVDAGELGAGHQVTAIYEIELERGLSLDDRAEIGVVSLRWEDPDSGEVIEIDEDIDLRDIEARWHDTPEDFQLAVVVVTLSEKLRDNPYADKVDMDDLATEAERLADDMRLENVDELARLVEIAADLT